jgi:hypothetical protein
MLPNLRKNLSSAYSRLKISQSKLGFRFILVTCIICVVLCFRCLLVKFFCGSRCCTYGVFFLLVLHSLSHIIIYPPRYTIRRTLHCIYFSSCKLLYHFLLIACYLRVAATNRCDVTVHLQSLIWRFLGFRCILPTVFLYVFVLDALLFGIIVPVCIFLWHLVSWCFVYCFRDSICDCQVQWSC